MLPSTTGCSLTSSSHLLAATWENALKHFRRALLECGSPLDIEHSQRIGLLFSHYAGNTNELKRWASIFDAEAVPTTALILKALVNHGQWLTAVKLLELNKESGVVCELSEILGQCLVARGLWQQTLKITDILQRRHEVAPREKNLAIHRTSMLNTREKNDFHQMASNPAFLPEEERITYCGFVSAVARAYPSRQNWKEAVRILHDLEQLVDGDTKKKIYEYRIARLVHDGQAYRDVIEKSRHELGFLSSPSLTRSLLHCAIATSDCNLTMDCLKLLCSFGPNAISIRLFETACRLLVSSDHAWTKEDLARFESIVCENAALAKDRKLQKVLSAFCADYDLKIPVFLSSISMLASASKNTVTPSFVNSITNLDRLAGTLISHSRWEEALQVANLIRNGAAKSGNERIIIDMLRGSCSSWVKTLQLFT
ncbi:hypothetical protein, conserved [Leishmania tarentolae]|uniref:Uncharacterized protein n=1 Tax=Leishmania tarentolae TaxID=5689 RepID=A0A640KWA0_LEITA|nr:hypothetical protein, conserved [Leishmania tarentolae]